MPHDEHWRDSSLIQMSGIQKKGMVQTPQRRTIQTITPAVVTALLTWGRFLDLQNGQTKPTTSDLESSSLLTCRGARTSGAGAALTGAKEDGAGMVSWPRQWGH
jgi:hypothetical protein